MPSSPRSVLAGLVLAVALHGAPALAANVLVSQKGRVFEPAELRIAVGDTVEIANDDNVLHHVYIESPEFNFDSGEQPPGRRIRITFTRPGTFEVRCDIHPKMRLTVTVE